MSSVIVHRQKNRSPPPQPLDRHLSEIGEIDGTIYINVGIDSTCCKKRSQTIHKLTDGIVVPMIKKRNSNGHIDHLSAVLLNSRTEDDHRCDSINIGNCIYCGK